MTKTCRPLWISLAAALFTLPNSAAWANRQGVAVVQALLETPPVDAEGDAADDPAIWRDPKTGVVRIVGTQKKGGLYVYGLDGRIVQALAGGRPNNADLRPWAGGAVMATSDRADNAIVLWRIEPRNGAVNPTPLARFATGFGEIYGMCLGLTPEKLMAVATDKDGDVGVWALEHASDGSWTARKAGGFALGSIAEGCAVDDATGTAYVAQEDVGIWRFALSAPGGQGRRTIDRVKPAGSLAADIEGLAIWRRGAKGYLVASVQGESRFAVYDLDGANRYRGSFRIAEGARADAVSGTDGIDVISADLGPGFGRGLLVVQDDENTSPAAAQNFKYVPWADVERALGLGE